jgi:hypothetical protein
VMMEPPHKEEEEAKVGCRVLSTSNCVWGKPEDDSCSERGMEVRDIHSFHTCHRGDCHCQLSWWKDAARYTNQRSNWFHLCLAI